MRVRKYFFYKKRKKDLWGKHFIKKKTDRATVQFLNEFISLLRRGHFSKGIKKVFFKYKREQLLMSKNLLLNSGIVLRSFKNRGYDNLNFLLNFKSISSKLSFKRTCNTLYNWKTIDWLCRFGWFFVNIRKIGKNSKHIFSSKQRKNRFIIRHHIYNINTHASVRLKNVPWVKRRRIEFYMSHFYGFKNIKKFKKLLDLRFFKTRIKDFDMLFENYLCIFLLRCGLGGPGIYYIKQSIFKGHFGINYRIVLFPYFKFKIDDVIFVNPRIYKRVFKYVKTRMLTNTLFNLPKYIYFNFSILAGCIWRLPKRVEILAPLDFTVKRMPFGISNSVSYLK